MLDRFGYGNVHEELEGSATHGLGNILTLQSDVHAMFDNLNLWFEAVPGKVYSSYGLSLLHALTRVHTGTYLQCANIPAQRIGAMEDRESNPVHGPQR